MPSTFRLYSAIVDDEVASPGAITKLIAAIRRVAVEVPAAEAGVVAYARAHYRIRPEERDGEVWSGCASLGGVDDRRDHHIAGGRVSIGG